MRMGRNGSKTPAIMIQGTASHAGKSTLVAGLCRLFARRGVRVRPFKPQNMSNNAAVTADGGEIGRAQALQARAAMCDAMADMNPVLLKPESGARAQVILGGRRMGAMSARDYTAKKSALLPEVLAAYGRLCGEADLIIAEGAGSPAEVNLRAGDIANMGFAIAADMQVVLAGDIERGGVIASLIGTKAVLDEKDAARIRGFIINKFRGDVSLLADATARITDATAWPSLGIVPWFDGAVNLPREDSVGRREALGGDSDDGDGGQCRLHIAVPHLPRMANEDDLAPLAADPAIRLELVEAGTPLPLMADMVLLPGSKAVMADLAHFRKAGWECDLAAMIRRKDDFTVIGFCGGYQMLGKAIHDPHGIEGRAGSMPGLGLLDVETTLGREKSLRAVAGRMAHGGIGVKGYEIHLGETTGADCARPMLLLPEDGNTVRKDGAMRSDGKAMGCYLHGLTASGALRRAWVAAHGRGGGGGLHRDYDPLVEETLDALAEHLACHMDIAALEKIAGL